MLLKNISDVFGHINIAEMLGNDTTRIGELLAGLEKEYPNGVSEDALANGEFASKLQGLFDQGDGGFERLQEELQKMLDELQSDTSEAGQTADDLDAQVSAMGADAEASGEAVPAETYDEAIAAMAEGNEVTSTHDLDAAVSELAADVEVVEAKPDEEVIEATPDEIVDLKELVETRQEMMDTLNDIMDAQHDAAESVIDNIE